MILTMGASSMARLLVRIFMVVLLSSACVSSSCFVLPFPSSSFLSSFSASSPPLTQHGHFVTCHAKAGSNNNKKKKTAVTARGLKNQKKGSNSQSKGVTTRSFVSEQTSVVLPSVKTRAPPWQVLAKKDAEQNVKKEIQRRERVRQGIQENASTNEPESSKKKSRGLLSDADLLLLKWKRFNPSKDPCGMSFIGAYLEHRLPPRLGVPEIAFLGRSNVGKSSLLNNLAKSATTASTATTQLNNDQARVGKTPGATASVNLYAMLGPVQQGADRAKPILGLVDLPGFGYAKLSKNVQESVQLAAERYLSKREELALGILLVDARREPSNDDRAVLAALYDLGVPLVVVATKVDKLAKNQVEPSLQVIRQGLGLPNGQPLCVSSVTGEGTKDLWNIVLEACQVRVEELRNKFEQSNNVKDKDSSKEEGRVDYELDEEGNPLLFQDGDEIVYDQGFDWVHDTASVMYEGDDGDYVSNQDNEEAAFTETGFDDDDRGDIGSSDKEAFKLKNLKKRVRDMERRGEL